MEIMIQTLIFGWLAAVPDFWTENILHHILFYD